MYNLISKINKGLAMGLLACFTLTSFSLHKFYVSITEVKHNLSTSALEVSMKIFTDDLERALEAQGAPRLYLGTPKEHPESDKYTRRYLQNHFKITTDGEQRSVNYVGKEAELDVTWCYLEIKDIKTFKQLSITNSILTEVFDEQTNLVHLYSGEHKESVLLKKGSSTALISFDDE